MATILVADDNKHIAAVLEEYLKKEGHTPHIARDGRQALEMFRALSPDAVLLDVMMPVMEGFSVCREIRRTSTVPIIMVTTEAEKARVLEAIQAGISDYLVKPFDKDDLQKKVEKHCPALAQ